MSERVFRRAEFWEPETCTMLEIANVLGRWESASEWAERTQFSVVDNQRAESMAQGATKQRFEMAVEEATARSTACQCSFLCFACVERSALYTACHPGSHTTPAAAGT